MSESESNDACKFMNSSHPAFVHALALQHVGTTKGGGKGKVSFATMKNISLTSFTVSYVECHSGDMCMMNSVEIKFNPPLESVSHALPRLIKKSHEALTPRYSWLFTGLPLLILIIMVVFGYVTFVLKHDGLQDTLRDVPMALQILKSIFGSTETFYLAVKGSWYFAVFLHVLEAFYVACKFKTRFNLPVVALLNWFILVSCVGYPITSKGLEFIKIDDAQNSKKKA